MGSLSTILPSSEVETLLEEILKREGIKNEKLVISAGSSKGDGYLSFMTRVDVKGDDKELNLIIKCAPRMDGIREMAPIATAFDRETKFYESIFPAMQKFQAEKKLKDPFNSIVKFYKAVKDENKEVIIMENIRAKGFELRDAKIQMNEEHHNMLFKEYAKFHAISYAMKDQQPELFNEITQGMKDVFNPLEFDAFYQAFMVSMQKVLELFKGEKEIYNALDKFKSKIHDFFTFLDENKGNYTVITHGDCWSNNMMFKYTDSTKQTNPLEVRMLDFQLLRVGSPTLDLSYFFYASSSKKSLDQLDHYLNLYYETLQEQIRLMGSCPEKIISKEKLVEDWKIYCKFGYMMSQMIIKGVLTEKDELVDFTDLAETGESIESLMNRDLKNQEVINQRLMDLTRHMYENNFFEM